MIDISEKLIKSLKDNPEWIEKSLSIIAVGSTTTDVAVAHEIVNVWAHVYSKLIGTYIILHLADHNCNNTEKIVTSMLEGVLHKILETVEEGCDELGLDNPFDELSHNQKLVKELLKEN